MWGGDGNCGGLGGLLFCFQHFMAGWLGVSGFRVYLRVVVAGLLL